MLITTSNLGAVMSPRRLLSVSAGAASVLLSVCLMSVAGADTQWGGPGSGNGQFNGPVGVAVDGTGAVYVADAGNHRIQKFTRDWKSLGAWGKPGTRAGELYHPWGVAVDADGFVYVADHENDRVQKFQWSAG